METYDIRMEIGGELQYIGTYYKYSSRSVCYSPGYKVEEEYGDLIPDDILLAETEQKKPIPFFEQMISEANRDRSLKKMVYHSGPYTLIRKSKRTDGNFLVYRIGAKQGEEGFSAVDHSCPHRANADIREWAGHYSFHKMDDGTFEVELDEAWYWGGPHLDGGTIREGIPENWFSLPYEEFLSRVLTLVSAEHYKFTVEELKSREGLKTFLGF